MSANYTTDVDYPFMFIHEQTPIVMSMVAILAGRPHRFSASRFTYCDFGCGKGMTLNLLAACNPEGQFYGVDINASHIASAKALAEQVGLKNVTYIEASFDDLKSGDLPDLDYAAVAGIYSWLPSAARARLTNYIENRLKDSGLCFVHYVAMPGVSASLVTTTLTQLLASEYEGGSAARVVTAVTELQAILAGNPNLAFNKDLPQARQALAKQLKMDPNYIAHDILNRRPEGMWFHQVAREFAASGLGFIGPARMRMNAFGDLYTPAVTKPYNKFCAKHEDVILREEMVGLLQNSTIRMDIFGKSQDWVGPDEVGDFSNLYIFNLAGRNFKSARDHLKSSISIDLSQPIYDNILEGAGESGAEAAQIVSDCAQKYGAAETRRALIHLTGVNLISFGQQSGAITNGARTLNPSELDRFILFEMMSMSGPAPLPSKPLASCIQLNRTERILIAALVAEDLKDVWALIERNKINLRKHDGALVSDYADFEKVLPALLLNFQEQRLPDLLKIGLLN
jgi:SAM-dependent methyltransferase